MKYFRLYKIISFALFLLFYEQGYSQDYPNEFFGIYMTGVYSNAKKVPECGVFLINESSATFGIFEPHTHTPVDVQSCEWTLSTDIGNVFLQNNGNSCVFKLDKTITEQLKSSKSYNGLVFEGDSSVYVFAKIFCKGITASGELFETEYPVRLNYLPPKPHIEVVDVEWGNYFAPYDAYEDVILKIRCRKTRCDKYQVECSNRAWDYSTYYFEIVFSEEKEIEEISAGSASDLFRIATINEYGSYIHPVYFNFEKEIRAKAASVPVPVPVNNIEIEEANSLELYPNPVKDILNINSGGKEIMYTNVYAVTSGKQFIRKEMHGMSILNVEKLPAGIYILTTEYAAGKKESVKFIKE